MNEQLFSVWDELRIVKVLLALVYSVFYHVLTLISRFVFPTFVTSGYSDVGDMMMVTDKMFGRIIMLMTFSNQHLISVTNIVAVPYLVLLKQN